MRLSNLRVALAAQIPASLHAGAEPAHTPNPQFTGNLLPGQSCRVRLPSLPPAVSWHQCGIGTLANAFYTRRQMPPVQDPVIRIEPARGVSLRRRLGIVFLLAAAIAAPLWHLRILSLDMPSSQSDLLPRWIGTRVALRGQDPYSPETLRVIQRAYYGDAIDHGKPNRRQAFLYPAPVVVLLAPLTLLSWHAARIAFTAGVIPLLIGSFWLCIRALNLRLTGGHTTAILVLTFFSWPVIWGLRLEQLTLPVAALIFLAWFLLARGRQFVPGILLALTIIKPQMVVPLLLWLFVWAILRRNWVFIASFAGTLALLLGVTQKLVPGWFSHWLVSLHNYSAVTKTAPPLEFVLGHWIGLPLTILLAAWSAFALWRLLRAAPGSAEFATAISLVLATTVALLPTDATMVYNQVLLLPACLTLLGRRSAGAPVSAARGFAVAQLVLEFVAVAVAAIGESLTGPNDFWSVLPFVDHFLAPLLTFVLASEFLRRAVIHSATRDAIPQVSCA